MSDIRAQVEAVREQLVADLVRYTEFETPSDDLAALDACLEWLTGWVTERIGAPDAARTVDGGESGDIAVLDWHSEAATKIAILCHYDTVWPMGTLAGWPVEIDGDRLTGPGVFDMKAGLVQAVWAIRIAREAGLRLPGIRLILTGDEEVGSPASRTVIEEAVVGHDATLVFEASAEGKLKTSRKGAGIFKVSVHGVEGHAGLDPESGVSAIDEIARIVTTLHDATDMSRGTTVNVGTLNGGSRTNVTAGFASGMVDVRVAEEAEQLRIEQLLSTLEPVNPAAEVEVSGGWNRPIMKRSAGTVRLFEEAQKAAKSIGANVDEISVGGASDGNFVAALGIPVLDGLGAVGDGAHARHEWVSIDGMVERTALVAALLGQLAATR